VLRLEVSPFVSIVPKFLDWTQIGLVNLAGNFLTKTEVSQEKT